MRLYRIKDDYIRYLRGYDRRVTERKEESRPLVGILIAAEEKQYFIPVSAPRPKYQKMKNGKDFRKIDGGQYGAINFNNMIPVCGQVLMEFDFADEAEEKYRNLLQNQYKAIKADWSVIEKTALQLRKLIQTENNALSEYDRKIKERCCNLELLESVCEAYEAAEQEPGQEDRMKQEDPAENQGSRMEQEDPAENRICLEEHQESAEPETLAEEIAKTEISLEEFLKPEAAVISFHEEVPPVGLNRESASQDGKRETSFMDMRVESASMDGNSETVSRDLQQESASMDMNQGFSAAESGQDVPASAFAQESAQPEFTDSAADQSEEPGKKRWPRALLIGLSALLILLAAGGASVYLLFKYALFNQTNYVGEEEVTILESLEEMTYIDESGNVVVETEAVLDSAEESRLAAEHAAALEEAKETLVDATGTYNILLIGVDRRNSSWTGNSDVMMLVTVNYDKETIYLTSFLRDLYANIEGVGVRKLNASCAYGGAPLCVKTISQNYGVEINNYAMVDFNSAIDIIDAFGGVELEITEDERQVANTYIKSMCKSNDIPEEEHLIPSAGLVHLDGYQAVGYARNRYSGNTYDFGRTERQRKVVNALLAKAKTDSFSSLTETVQKILPYVTHNVDEMTILKLITQVPGIVQYNVVSQHIPYDGMYTSQNEILIPTNMAETIKKLRETIY